MPLVSFQTWEMCELKCKFCLYSSVKKIPGGWSLEKFKIAADKLIGIGIDRFDMTPTLGEITLDPHWKEKLSYIDGRVDYIQFYTHGCNLKDDDYKHILSLKSPLSMFVSVYGDSPEIFKETTGVDYYHKFLSSFKLFRGHIPFPKNKRIGVDIRFCSKELPISIKNIDFRNEFWKEVLTLQPQGEQFPIRNKYFNNNWGTDFKNQTFAKKLPNLENRCDCINVTLNPNGDALICDICHPYDEKFESLGNIFEDDAELIYRNLHNISKEMDKGIFPEICKNCTEYSCEGDIEDFYDGSWKERDRVFWKDDFVKRIGSNKESSRADC